MKFRIATLILALPLLTLTMYTNSFAAPAPNLATTADSWRVVLDGVMGGRSSGRLTTSVSGNLLFTGSLSLENNGGFSQARTAIPAGMFETGEGIQIKVRGDGRAYNVDVRVSNARMMAGAFQQEFQTLQGQWLTIQLPFRDFRLYSFGRRVPDAIALDPALIESVGVTLSDKNEGEFRLEIGEILPYGMNTEPTVTGETGFDTEAARLIELAINRGAPLFNAGQVAACASIYEITIESLVTLGGGRLDRAIILRLELSLAEAETQHSAADRAWTYRKAMDDVYTQLVPARIPPRTRTTH